MGIELERIENSLASRMVRSENCWRCEYLPRLPVGLV